MLTLGVNHLLSGRSSMAVRFGRQTGQTDAGNLPEKAPLPVSRGESKPWRKPSWFSKFYDRFFKLSMVVFPALGIISALPLPESIEKPKTEICTTLREETYPVRLVVFGMMLEILSHMVMRRKRIVLTHEAGHALGFYNMDRQIPDTKTSPGSATGGSNVAIEIEGPLGFFFNPVRSGLATPFSQRLGDYIDRLVDECGVALENGTFYTPVFEAKRSEMKRMLRLDNITTVAGPMLEDFLLGRTVPLSDYGDRSVLRERCKMLAIAEKPLEQWANGEYNVFIRKVRDEAYREAEALITSLDRNAVEALIQQMMTEARQGKSQWSGAELYPRFAKVFGHLNG